MKIEWLPAYDVDVNARTEGNRLFTAVNKEDGLPRPGDPVVVACLDHEWENKGRAKIVTVHEVYESEDHPENLIISFDWLDGQTCH